MRVTILDNFNYLNDIQKARLKRVLKYTAPCNNIKDIILEYLFDWNTVIMPLKIEWSEDTLTIELLKYKKQRGKYAV